MLGIVNVSCFHCHSFIGWVPEDEENEKDDPGAHSLLVMTQGRPVNGTNQAHVRNHCRQLNHYQVVLRFNVEIQNVLDKNY
jgi:hypothetical protein